MRESMGSTIYKGKWGSATWTDSLGGAKHNKERVAG